MVRKNECVFIKMHFFQLQFARIINTQCFRGNFGTVDLNMFIGKLVTVSVDLNIIWYNNSNVFIKLTKYGV